MTFADRLHSIQEMLAFYDEAGSRDEVWRAANQQLLDQLTATVAEVQVELGNIKAVSSGAEWFQFEIPGRPQPWDRPRGRVVVPAKPTARNPEMKPWLQSYETEKNRSGKQAIALLARSAMKSYGVQIATQGRPVSLDVSAFFRIPQSLSAAKREALTTWYPQRPDEDNIGKLVSDGLNGVAYDDDAQVVEKTVRKLRCEKAREERVVVRVTLW